MLSSHRTSLCGILLVVIGFVLPAFASAETAQSELYPIQKLLNSRQYPQALPLLEERIKTTPNDAEARFLLGVTLSNLQKTDEALAVFTQLTEDFPELAEPYNNLAVIWANRGDWVQARQALEMAIRANPGYAVAHENLGDIYARMSVEHYRQAQTLDSRNQPLDRKLRALSEVVETPPQAYVPRRVPPNATTSSLPF